MHFGASLIARAVGHCHGAEAVSDVLWCKSQAALPKPLGLPWLRRGSTVAGLSWALQQWEEVLAGFAFQRSTQKPRCLPEPG